MSVNENTGVVTVAGCLTTITLTAAITEIITTKLSVITATVILISLRKLRPGKMCFDKLQQIGT